jgi:DNA primase
LWYCFHADCNVKGRTGITLTKDFAKHALSRKEKPTPAPDTSVFQIPDTFVSLSRNLDAELYVRSVNAYDAYLSGRADIQYDFKRNRVVYMVKDGRRIVDAAGRAIDGRKPKWYRYGNSKLPFVCGTHRTGFVVEDCASACAISRICSGIALLGTNLLPEHIDLLTQYEKINIALDKDATDKALDMVRTLHNRVPTKLVILKQDLKNMKGDERDEFLRQYID